MAASLVLHAEPAPDREFRATLHTLDQSRGFLVADDVRYPLAAMFRLFDADGNQMTGAPPWGTPVYLEIYDGQVIRAHVQPEETGGGRQ
ncbi:MAG: hypothetical protein JJU06_10510 [Ectothiorhodospiraceae bacterium]|nr:hypothetical protein [Ectothiorhodospiraceae bacterium]MCH8506520.1 hypothetical protein [Ectothiorhodospiraceae bacterium]